MKKHLVIVLTIIATALWFGALPSAAQGRSAQGRGGGMSASHMPMGMGIDHTTGPNESTHGPNYSSPSNHASSGPKTPGELLDQNQQLASKLGPLVGCTGSTSGACLQTAADGFKNLGQFVAAAHVSHNLGISFDCLKANMTGTTPPLTSSCPDGTGTSKMNLGKSIQALNPTMTSSQIKSATKTANKEAKKDMSKS